MAQKNTKNSKIRIIAFVLALVAVFSAAAVTIFAVSISASDMAVVRQISGCTVTGLFDRFAVRGVSGALLKNNAVSLLSSVAAKNTSKATNVKNALFDIDRMINSGSIHY